MRVGFFTYGMESKLTGIGRYTVELTRALARQYPIEIVLLNPYPHAELAWYEEFETHAVPRLRRVPEAASLGNWVLHRAALSLGLDILHDPCGIAPFLLPTRRYRRVTTVHDAIPLVTPEVQPLATRVIFRTLIPAARFTADAVLTVSQASAEDLVRYARLPANKVHVTPNGVAPPLEVGAEEAERARKRLGVCTPYFLYVGNLAPRKNLARVIAAFERLQKEHPETHLVIVGPASWRAHETLARARSLAKVVFTGYVEDRELAALYGGATALVFPSLYEGFGLPALEAMLYGAPVLTSSTSSLPEVVGKAALLVEPTDTTAIFKAMQALLTRPELAAQLRTLGYARAQLFSWQRTAETTYEVYRQLGVGDRSSSVTKTQQSEKIK